MELKWSLKEISDFIDVATQAQVSCEVSMNRYRQTRLMWQTALRAAYQAGFAMDSEGLSSAHRALETASDLSRKVKRTAGDSQDLIESAMRSISRLMTVGDYRNLCRHNHAMAFLKAMSQYPTGSVYQITWPMTLETAAYHAQTYWDPSGCHYTFGGAAEGNEFHALVVGTPRALLLWVLEEFDDIEPLLQNFSVCEDELLIRRYIEQHRIVADPTEELEEKLGTS